MRVLFRGEKRWWLQMWGADVGRSKHSCAKGNRCKVCQSKRHIDLGLWTFSDAGDANITCRAIS